MRKQRACPFCEVEPHRVIHEDSLIRCLWDAFPLNPGHALVVPRRHIASWFDATPDEHAALVRGVSLSRDVLRERHRADAMTIGINDGVAAGQTVPHLHVHVIPRVVGDVADPRGGVRWVVPERAAYWEQTE